MHPILMDAAAFGLLVALVYAAHLAGYFGLNAAIEAMNRRNAGRRIQTRRGDKRRREEIRKSFGSMLVTSVSVSIGLFAVSKGWTLFAPFELTWWTAVPLFVATMVLFDGWFYFGHRLLHTPKLYRFHRQHHYSVSPTVWSTYSDDVVDTAICQGFYAVVPLLLPFPPVILILHRIFDHVNGTFGHAGFEYFASPTARHPSPMLCATYHDLQVQFRQLLLLLGPAARHRAPGL